ncbi:hypothetical protein [Mucilaginibacter sp.]|uniref:hypothetical protein n=1 Tax=Mucilaginibacter sp. TaxID=1882438 RepID=UPI002635C0B4|nr:hypothetical protein [Mucilaginibacter sp.]MDB4924016.1 hypothetical protein [Mucilaginibacter sp.]
MEKFEISVTDNNENLHFEVFDYMHHDGENCKYEVFKNGQFVGSFEPDGHKILHICKNPGVIKKSMLHLIADQLESYNI